MRNIDKKQIRGDIVRRKAMPDFGISPDTNISRLKTIQETQRSFNLEVVETLLDELEAKEEQRANWFQMAEKLGADLDAAERRITELEARLGVMRGYCKHQFFWDVSNVQRCARCGISISSTDGKGAA